MCASASVCPWAPRRAHEHADSVADADADADVDADDADSGY